MQDFPANSNKAKATDAPREKLTPVTSAEAVRRKQGLGRQFKETFFSGSARDAFGYMIEEVVIPTVRDMFADAMQSGIDRLIYGDRVRPRGRGLGSLGGTPSSTGYVAYNRMNIPSQTQTPQRMLSRRDRARHDLSGLVIPSRQEAEEVIDQLFEIMSRDGTVSVADLYELTDIQSAHTDMKWGWRSLRGAKAVRRRQGGFLLDLPEPEALG